MKAKFYICRRCGNLVQMMEDSAAPLSCCGEKMEELQPNTVEASGEKHIPVTELRDGVLTVKIGSVAHPMTPEHSIRWIHVETEKGSLCRRLEPGEAPEARFVLGDEKPVAVYAWCNLHGLWMSRL